MIELSLSMLTASLSFDLSMTFSSLREEMKTKNYEKVERIASYREEKKTKKWEKEKERIDSWPIQQINASCCSLALQTLHAEPPRIGPSPLSSASALNHIQTTTEVSAGLVSTVEDTVCLTECGPRVTERRWRWKRGGVAAKARQLLAGLLHPASGKEESSGCLVVPSCLSPRWQLAWRAGDGGRG